MVLLAGMRGLDPHESQGNLLAEARKCVLRAGDHDPEGQADPLTPASRCLCLPSWMGCPALWLQHSRDKIDPTAPSFWVGEGGTQVSLQLRP